MDRAPVALEQGTDVVMVDTGNSYEGLCGIWAASISIYRGASITMNPFRIQPGRVERGKRDSWKTSSVNLKDSQGTVTKTEDRLIEHVITEYYDAYFNGFRRFHPNSVRTCKSLLIDDRNSSEAARNEQERAIRIEGMIDEMEGRRKELKVPELSFNLWIFRYSASRISVGETYHGHRPRHTGIWWRTLFGRQPEKR